MAGLGASVAGWKRLAWAWAAVAALGCALVPIQNPDLFWHLSAARRMLETGALPRADWLSHTFEGAPWLDFEWLPQILFALAGAAAGLPALWGLKAALMGVWAMLVRAACRAAGVPGWEPAAVSLWAACALARSDLRPDLFSVIAFAWLFLRLEEWRQGGKGLRLWAVLMGFALWANSHPGFAYGLLLLSFYEAGRLGDAALGWHPRIPPFWPCLLAAGAGTLIQPHGFGIYKVLWAHWRDMDLLSASILEWRPVRLTDPWHWPFWLPLLLGFGAALAHLLRRRSVPLGPLAAILYFGWAAAAHARLGAYYVTIAIPLSLLLLREAKLIPPTRSAPAGGVAAWGVAITFLCGLYVFWAGNRLGLLRRAFNDRFIPARAAEFLAENRSALGGRPLYHPWGWGGYLGWRLYPDYRVFQDGRYIFHPLLQEAQRGFESPEAWQEFLDRRRVDVALLEDIPLLINGAPYEALYMPRPRWALVHQDGRARVFVRRKGVPRSWLRKTERSAGAGSRAAPRGSGGS